MELKAHAADPSPLDLDHIAGSVPGSRASERPDRLELPRRSDGETILWPEQVEQRLAIEDATTERTTLRETRWEVLDRFIQEHQDEYLGNPIFKALEAMCDGTGADVAFLYCERLARVTDIVGSISVSPEWCHEIVRRLNLNTLREELIHRCDLSWGNARSVEPIPVSIAVVRIELDSWKWAVVAGFNPTRRFQASDVKLLRLIWKLVRDHLNRSDICARMKETLFGVVRCLSAAIDAKDSYTCGHSERVARIAVRLGQEMGLSHGEISDLYLTGLLHDIGKIGIRDEVLLKPSALTTEEYDHVKQHPEVGAGIIANVKRLAYLCPGIRSHHERFDGGGYPDGLMGEAIPYVARIIAVADSCDAMTSRRRYRLPIPRNRIEQIFREGEGSQWDPEIVKYFLSCRNELYSVSDHGLGQSLYVALDRATGPDNLDA